MKEDKVFIDTNVLVYAYDASAGEKHKIALEQFCPKIYLISR